MAATGGAGVMGTGAEEAWSAIRLPSSRSDPSSISWGCVGGGVRVAVGVVRECMCKGRGGKC